MRLVNSTDFTVQAHVLQNNLLVSLEFNKRLHCNTNPVYFLYERFREKDGAVWAETPKLL